MNDAYDVLAFYHICSIENPKQEMKEQKRFCKEHDLTGRVYLADHGINGQMSGSKEASKAYQEWMQSRPLYKGIIFKIHTWDEHCFPRMQIKVKPKLVACDHPIAWDTRGEHVSPERWSQLLESEQRPPVFDVRNDYEWEIGRFKGSEKPPGRTFRDFAKWADNLSQNHDREKPVMMCCTGGIRCELFSSMLMERGFKKVYQLDGGIINYGLKEGKKHWEGKLFVFDDRMAVPISDEPAEKLGKCHHCQAPTDMYYNCSDMDCNELYLACDACLEKHLGCCSEPCKHAPRLRPLNEQKPHKPFRKWYRYRSTKKALSQEGDSRL